MKQEDYPEFDKKPVKVGVKEFSGYPDFFEGTVVACNRSVGITIQEGNFKFCLNGKSSPHWKGYCKSHSGYEKNYEKAFDTSVKMIKKGELNVSKIRNILKMDKHSSSSVASCAYSGS